MVSYRITTVGIVLLKYTIFHIQQGVDPVEDNTRIVVVQMSKTVFVRSTCPVTVGQHDPVVLSEQGCFDVKDGDVFFSLFRSKIELVLVQDCCAGLVTALRSSTKLE